MTVCLYIDIVQKMGKCIDSYNTFVSFRALVTKCAGGAVRQTNLEGVNVGALCSVFVEGIPLGGRSSYNMHNTPVIEVYSGGLASFPR